MAMLSNLAMAIAFIVVASRLAFAAQPIYAQCGVLTHRLPGVRRRL